MSTYSRNSIIAILLILISNAVSSGSLSDKMAHFYVMPLGTSGGILQDNLSAYLAKPQDASEWVAFDAGTLCSAINNISAQEFNKMGIKTLLEESPAKALFTRYLKAYLISHAHLDHVSGMIICSPDDTAKQILGLDTTIDYLRDNIFNGKIWVDFADEGMEPRLKKYQYQRLKIGQSYPIANTSLKVRAFPLSHGPHYQSTAFLLEHEAHYMLYIGDTGPDSVEKSSELESIWQQIAPLIRQHKLHAIFIEASYPNSRPDNLLYGHLTPNWLLKELHQLAEIVDADHPQTALKDLAIVITHIKQGLEKQSSAPLIMEQLQQANDLQVRFVLPQQGQLLSF